MKKLFYVLIALMVTSLLGGCGLGTGSSAPPPPWLTSTAGDGRVVLNWTATPGVDYWVFYATDPSLTAFNWTGLANAQALVASPVPSYICGLIDGMTYYFATNGRINGGPGGPSSPTISLTPHNASTQSWHTAPISSTSSPDIYGLGYTGLTTCANNTALSATGTYAAVGAGGVIFTSPDAISWTGQSSPIATNLNAVAGYAAYQNNTVTPGLRWVAVGDGGTAVYSIDGINWIVGNPANSSSPANPGNNTLRSITQVGGTFWAVGDKGTVINSSDGINWNSAWTSITTNNLNGISYAGGVYVVVGDSGTIMTNGTLVTPPTTAKLNQVATIATAYGSIYVAVGDGGTIVTTNSGYQNGKWSAVTLPAAPNLVGVTVEPLGVETTTAYTTAPGIDPWLGFIAAAQFVAIDEAGNTYTSLNGHDWTGPGNNFGTICTAGTTCKNPLTSSGFGYVAVGISGKTAYAF